MNARKSIFSISIFLIGFFAFAQPPSEYIHQQGDKVNLKKKSIVFAEKIWQLVDQELQTIQSITANQQQLLGTPDLRNNPTKTCFEMAYREEVILSFKDRLIQNEKGKDLFVFNAKELNRLKVFLSENGKNWKAIGELSNETPFLNLKSIIEPQANYKYLKLKNNCRVKGKGASVYLDAIGIAVDKKKFDYRWFEIDMDTLYLPDKPMYVRLRDNSVWDGDRVDLFIDDEKFLKDVMISKLCKKHELPLSEGLHEIKIRAITEGRIKPNTVQVEIIVDDRIYYKALRLKKKRSATLAVEVL